MDVGSHAACGQMTTITSNKVTAPPCGARHQAIANVARLAASIDNSHQHHPEALAAAVDAELRKHELPTAISP